MHQLPQGRPQQAHLPDVAFQPTTRRRRSNYVSSIREERFPECAAAMPDSTNRSSSRGSASFSSIRARMTGSRWTSATRPGEGRLLRARVKTRRAELTMVERPRRLVHVGVGRSRCGRQADFQALARPARHERDTWWTVAHVAAFCHGSTVQGGQAGMQYTSGALTGQIVYMRTGAYIDNKGGRPHGCRFVHHASRVGGGGEEEHAPLGGEAKGAEWRSWWCWRASWWCARRSRVSVAAGCRAFRANPMAPGPLRPRLSPRQRLRWSRLRLRPGRLPAWRLRSLRGSSFPRLLSSVGSRRLPDSVVVSRRRWLRLPPRPLLRRPASPGVPGFPGSAPATTKATLEIFSSSGGGRSDEGVHQSVKRRFLGVRFLPHRRPHGFHSSGYVATDSPAGARRDSKKWRGITFCALLRAVCIQTSNLHMVVIRCERRVCFWSITPVRDSGGSNGAHHMSS